MRCICLQGREEPVEYLMWNILFNDKSPLMLEVIFSMIWYDWNIVFKDLFPDCIQQNYGDDCSLPCSEFCVDGRCNSSNGVCLQGCQPGYLGSHCNRSKNIHIALISTCMYKFSKYRLVNLSRAPWDLVSSDARGHIEKRVKDLPTYLVHGSHDKLNSLCMYLFLKILL